MRISFNLISSTITLPRCRAVQVLWCKLNFFNQSVSRNSIFKYLASKLQVAFQALFRHQVWKRMLSSILADLWSFSSLFTFVWLFKCHYFLLYLCLTNTFGCNKLQLSIINRMNFFFQILCINEKSAKTFQVHCKYYHNFRHFFQSLQHVKMDLSTIVYRSINLNPLKYFMINFQSTCKKLKPNEHNEQSAES